MLGKMLGELKSQYSLDAHNMSPSDWAAYGFFLTVRLRKASRIQGWQRDFAS
jgi:hypothetical protein